MADQAELVDWIMRRLPFRRGLFLTHGEDESRTALRDILVGKSLSQRRIHLPQLDDVVNLMGDGGSRRMRQA